MIPLKQLLSKLEPHKTGKACVHIKDLADVNMAVLEELIMRSYQYVMAHKIDMHHAE